MVLLKEHSWNLLQNHQAGETLWTRTLRLVDADLPASSDMGRRRLHVTEIDSPLSTAIFNREPQSVLARPSSTPQYQAPGTVIHPASYR